jgi:predicted ribosome quality control (RQC) complex YloA/Tae2 family protein
VTLGSRELELLSPELDELVGGSLREVRCPSATAVWIEVRVPGKNLRLYLETAANLGRIHLVSDKMPQRERPTGFVMLLRKHIVGARVVAISRLPHDRHWRLHLTRHGEDFSLLMRWRRAGGNLYLLDADDGIAGSLHTIAPQAPNPLDMTPPPERVRAALQMDPLGLEGIPVGQRSAAVHAHYTGLGETSDATREAAARTRLLRKALKTARRKLLRIEKDVAKVEDAPRWRRYGELLQSAYGKVPRGAASARVQDFYDPTLVEVEIPLDPLLDLGANIERYFRRYKKYTDAEEVVLGRLELIQAQVDALTHAIDNDDVDIDALRQAGHLPRARVQSRRREATPTRRPYHTFKSRSGLTILVGRGGKDNDALSLKVARGNDVWLHAKDWAGAHVIIRVAKGSAPDHEALLDAALLAVHYSKGRADSVTDVLYTHAKHIRKPKGAPAGRVTVAGGKGIAVRPDPDRLERLMANRGDD